jgi:hypothetical protein
MIMFASNTGALQHHSIADAFDAFSLLDRVHCLKKIDSELLAQEMSGESSVDTLSGGAEREVGPASDDNRPAVDAPPFVPPTSVCIQLLSSFIATLPAGVESAGRGPDRLLSWLLGSRADRQKQKHSPVLVSSGGGHGVCWQASAFSITKHPFTISVLEDASIDGQRQGSSSSNQPAYGSSHTVLVTLESTSPAELALLREAVLRRVLCHQLTVQPLGAKSGMAGAGVDSDGKNDGIGAADIAPMANGLCQIADRLHGAMSALLEIEDGIHALQSADLERLIRSHHTAAAVPVQTAGLISRLMRVYFQVRQCSGESLSA